jgi:hypothetical protein
MRDEVEGIESGGYKGEWRRRKLEMIHEARLDEVVRRGRVRPEAEFEGTI